MTTLNPSPSPSPSSTQDVAAAMGFSTFGGTPYPPRTKKRRLADPSKDSSGSNNTPLGVRTRPQADEEWETADRVYENEGDSAAERGWRGSNGLAPEEVLDVAASNQDGNSGLEETGLLPRDRGWDGDAGGGHDVPPQGKGQDMKGGGGQGDGAVGTAAGERMRREGRKEDGEWDWQALRRGVADERGDVAFYDASFVEDPWRGLGGGRKPSV